MRVINHLFYLGDVLKIASQLKPQSINCIVTSPPYWGLRDYGTEPQIWGGDTECQHEWGESINCPTKNGTQGSTETVKNSSLVDNMGKPKGSAFCSKCGGWLGSLGLEPTPDLYVEHMVEIFRALRPALRDDGTLWLNLGDTYNGSKVGNTETRKNQKAVTSSFTKKPVAGLKPKDLVGIPWMVAFALRADGWFLRSDIIWNKSNPMPESVRDRPTKAHEYIFLLSKARRYYYDREAIKEPATHSSIKRWAQNIENQKGSDRANGGAKTNGPMKAVGGPRTDKQRGHSRRHAGFNDRWDSMTKEEQCSMGRNKRTVWTLGTRPFSGAHFAVFPEKLIEPCILAGCPPGGTVLDPFGGRGTVAKVAEQHGRNSIYIDLKQEYIDIAKEWCGFKCEADEFRGREANGVDTTGRPKRVQR